MKHIRFLTLAIASLLATDLSNSAEPITQSFSKAWNEIGALVEENIQPGKVVYRARQRGFYSLPCANAWIITVELTVTTKELEFKGFLQKLDRCRVFTISGGKPPIESMLANDGARDGNPLRLERLSTLKQFPTSDKISAVVTHTDDLLAVASNAFIALVSDLLLANEKSSEGEKKTTPETKPNSAPKN
jgi:hypothetical protein